MKTKIKLSLLTLCAALTAAGAGTGSAQAPAAVQNDPGEMALKYSGILATNRQKLGGYSWQVRQEVAQGGELVFVNLVEGRYDSAGQLQTTEINANLEIKKRHGFLNVRAGLQEDRLQKIKATVGNVKKWMLAYIYMSRGHVVDFFDQGTKTVTPGYPNVISISKANVLNPGDNVTLTVDKISGSPISLAFSVPAGEGGSIQANISFRHLRSNAAFYPDHATVRVVTEKEKKDLTMKLEAFDFMKQL